MRPSRAIVRITSSVATEITSINLIRHTVDLSLPGVEKLSDILGEDISSASEISRSVSLSDLESIKELEKHITYFQNAFLGSITIPGKTLFKDLSHLLQNKLSFHSNIYRAYFVYRLIEYISAFGRISKGSDRYEVTRVLLKALNVEFFVSISFLNRPNGLLELGLNQLKLSNDCILWYAWS